MFFFFFNKDNKQNTTNYDSVSDAIHDIVQTMMDKVMIGGEGTYKHFIADINKLGVHYKERIYREFLGIEPPEGYDKEALK